MKMAARFMKPFDASWRVPAHACAANFRGYRACRNNIQLTEIRYRVTISLPFHLRYRAARKESKWTPSLPSSQRPLSRPVFRRNANSSVSTHERSSHLYLFSVSPSFEKLVSQTRVDRIARNYTSNRPIYSDRKGRDMLL